MYTWCKMYLTLVRSPTLVRCVTSYKQSLKLPTNVKLNPLPSICLSMSLYSLMNNLMTSSKNTSELVSSIIFFSLILWIKISVSTSLSYMSYSKTTPTIIHEDFVLFNSSIFSIKYVFISSKYSSITTTIILNISIIRPFYRFYWNTTPFT